MKKKFRNLKDKELAAITGEDVSVLPRWLEISRRLGSKDPRYRIASSPAHRQRIVEVMRREYEAKHGLHEGTLG